MESSIICGSTFVLYVLGGFVTFSTAQIKTLGPSFQGWSIGATSSMCTTIQQHRRTIPMLTLMHFSPLSVARAITCSTDAAFVTSGTYANCCPTTDAKCPFPVSCSSNKIIWDNGGVYEWYDENNRTLY